jgi:hypothetical protein
LHSKNPKKGLLLHPTLRGVLKKQYNRLRDEENNKRLQNFSKLIKILAVNRRDYISLMFVHLLA